MAQPNVQTIETMSFEGIISPSFAIGCGVAMALLVAWLLWRERHALGRPWALLFWVLRVVTCAVVLWMLLGPASVTILRTTSPQRIALFVDRSDSMTISDPDNAADDLRWSLAANRSQSTSMVGNCDCAVAALTATRKQCQHMTESIDAHAPLADLRESVDAVARTSTRARHHMELAADAADSHTPALVDRAEQINRLLEGPVKDSCDRLRAEIDRGAQANLATLAQAAQTLLEYVSSAQRRSMSLSEDVTNRLTATSPSSLIDVARTRMEHVDAAVDSLEKGPLSSLAEKCQIERFQFAQLVTSANDQKTPRLTNATDRNILANNAKINSSTARSNDSAATNGGPATNLSSVLEEISSLHSQGSLQLALVYTDGRHNAPGSLSPQEAAAKLAGQPVFFVPIGAAKQVRDVAIHRIEAPTVARHHDTVDIEVLVTMHDCQDKKVGITLRQDGNEIEHKKIPSADGQMDHHLVFRVKAEKLGWQRYDLEIDPVEGEASTANNRAAVAFEVVKDKIRVLLADRSPRYEYRYLLQLFRRDKHIEFDDLLFLPQLRATGHLEKKKGLPKTVDDWAYYDVVILGDLSPQQLDETTQQSLKDYVTRRGGNVILIAGSEYMPAAFKDKPLMELVPVESTGPIPVGNGFELALPDQAHLESPMLVRDNYPESQATWKKASQMMPIEGLSEYSIPKAATNTLIHAVAREKVRGSKSADQRAFISWRPIGAGRVVYLAAPQSYLLRILRGDRDHHHFWGQTLRWITAAQMGSGSNLVRFLTDRTIYEWGQPVEVVAWLKDKAGRPITGTELRAEARSPDEKVVASIRLASDSVAGRSSGVFERLPPGVFEITLAGELADELAGQNEKPAYRTRITVHPSNNVEMLDTQANRPLLEQLAELTGGQVLPPTAVSEVLEQASVDPKVSEVSRRQPLWNRWSYLLLVVGCLICEWVVRKHKGLV